MDSKAYLTLNSWLQKADQNYISGRLLWLNMLITGACNLLWLSCEQMIKLLLLQMHIEELSPQCKDLDELHDVVDKKAGKWGHSVDKLLNQMFEQYPALSIEKHRDVLEKLHEYFYRRYVERRGSSISLNMLHNVDELYFLLRSQVEPDVGLGTIDEIVIQRKNKWGHPLQAFAVAYMDNLSFKPRRHRKISIIGPDGKTYDEDGSENFD